MLDRANGMRLAATMATRGRRLDDPAFRPIFQDAIARKMAIMTHIGDPDTWYAKQYVDSSKFGEESFVRFADLAELDVLVTDAAAPADLAAALDAAGVEVVLA